MKTRTLISGAVAVTAAGAITVAGTLVAQAQETGSAALGEAIETILADNRIVDSQAGVLVRDAATGEVLYDHNGNQRAIPASNNKIATAAAALEILGEDHTFTTDVLGDRPVDGVVSGDLYLRGSGDASMLQADYDQLAADLAAAGVSTVDGDLVADDTAFDHERHGEEWAWGDLQYSYGAEISALTVGSGTEHLGGTVRIYVDPGAAEGEDLQITTVPETDYFTIVNEATTGAPGSGDEISILRDEHANTVRITGTLGTDADQTYGTRAVINPTGLVADVFADALADNGIDLTGDIRLGETAPQGGETLASHASAPLSELATELLKRSNNSYAESFFKAVGAATADQGTFTTGQEAVYATLAEYGVDTEPIRQVDGSGSSRFDETTPETLTDLFIAAKGASWADTWYDALPIACESDPMVGGTLASRMCGTPAAGNVHAKTGTITSVSALSGYVTDADGRDLVFSIMLNDHLADSVKDVEDQIAAAIAGHSENATADEIATFGNVEELAETGTTVPGDRECTWYEPVPAC